MYKLLLSILISCITSTHTLPVKEIAQALVPEKCSSLNQLHTLNENNNSLINFTNNINQTCEDCKILVHLIQHQLITANTTIQDLIKLVQDICQKIVSPSGEECLHIIDNIQVIIKWITEGISFQQICQKLGFCSSYKVSQNRIRNRRYNIQT